VVVADIGVEPERQPHPGPLAEQPGVAELLDTDVVNRSPVQDATLEVGIIRERGIASGRGSRATHRPPRGAVEGPGIAQRTTVTADRAAEENGLSRLFVEGQSMAAPRLRTSPPRLPLPPAVALIDPGVAQQRGDLVLTPEQERESAPLVEDHRPAVASAWAS
jgi:hypothetical protein